MVPLPTPCAQSASDPPRCPVADCVQPDHHETRLLTGSFLEKEDYSTCTKDDFAPVTVHNEPKVGVREAMIIQALMEEAKNPPPEPEPKMQFDREYDAYARESKPWPAATESYGHIPAITVYTHNGKNSIAPDGNFGKNDDFSCPAERYTKGPYKNE